MKISDIVQRSDTTPGRIFDGFLSLALIVVSVITLSIGHVCRICRPSRGQSSTRPKSSSWGCFTLEYCLRVADCCEEVPLHF